MSLVLSPYKLRFGTQVPVPCTGNFVLDQMLFPVDWLFYQSRESGLLFKISPYLYYR